MERIDRLVEDDLPEDAWTPPTCEDSPGECDWSEETVGYEEQERTLWVCHTHNAERWGT